MPLRPVRSYDEPGYPTLESDGEARRAFLRSIGLAAIAAAFGPNFGCDRIGGTVAGLDKNAKNAGPGNTSRPPDMPTAGTPLPPKWPGQKAALVGGGPIPVTFSGGDKGWVALAVTFDPNDTALEDTLVGLESEIIGATQKRLAGEPRSVLGDTARCDVVEKDLTDALNRLAKTDKLASSTLAELSEDAVNLSKAVGRPPQAPSPAPAPSAEPAPSAGAAGAPVASAPAAPARKRLPRAGDKCAIHPNGCEASEGK